MVGAGLDPQKMAQVQAVSRHIAGEVRIDYKEGTIVLSLSSEEESAQMLIPSLVGQLGEALAVQLSAFFSIQGEIVEVNKPK